MAPFTAATPPMFLPAGKGAKYTKTRRPVRLLYQEAFTNEHDALSAEWHFKHQSRKAKEAFLDGKDVKWR